MLIPAYTIVDIEPNIEYDPENPIYRLHCLRTNASEVIIETFDGNKSKFPSGAFIAGALYDILIKKMQFNIADSSFKGYKFKSKPRTLDI